MAKQNAALLSFNAGEVSRRALARVDVERLRLSAERQVNWQPSVLGPMSLRPGMQYIAGVLDNSAAKMVPFIFSRDDTAIIELTPATMRVLVDDVVVSRVAVSTTVVNGDFNSSTGWTLTAPSGTATIAGTADAAPSVTGTARSVTDTSSTSHAATLPSDIQIGELLLVILSLDGTSASWPTGWTELTEASSGSVRFTAGYRVADGSEDGTVTVSTASATKSAHNAYRIANYDTGGLEITTNGQSSTSVPNPPALTPTWGSNYTLWIAALANCAPRDFSSAPSGFSPGMTATNSGSSSSTSNFRCTSAILASTTGTQNPGTFSLTGTASCVTATIGIRPMAPLRLAATGKGSTSSAVCYVTVDTADLNVAHALRVVVRRGPVQFKVGSTLGGSEYFEYTLDTGEHSLEMTPTDHFYVMFSTTLPTTKVVESVEIETVGAMELPTPWSETDLTSLRYDQSGDIIFCACDGVSPRKIERRSTNSWSVVKYEQTGGPFTAPSAAHSQTQMTVGNSGATQTVTASAAYFEAEMVGSLLRIVTAGQQFDNPLAAASQFTKPIRVLGIGTDQDFTITAAGTWAGTLWLQRSIDAEDSGYVDVGTVAAGGPWTISPGSTYNNIVQWYRVGFKSGLYTSGTANISMSFSGGGWAGTGRIVSVESSTSATLDILTQLSSSQASTDWYIGDWSTDRGWPSSVRFFDGRLWWAARDAIWGSVSDDYTNFDIETEGDSGPISRSIGFGPISTVHWMLDLSRLIIGRDAAETVARASSLDEPITPTALTLKDCSTQGSAPIQAVKFDQRGIFVQASDRRVYELALDNTDYRASDMTRLNDDIGTPGFVAMAVQRQPDTAIHCVLGDGKVAILLRDVDDSVTGWWRLETDGTIESVAVLPGDLEDRVYYVVNRTINGSTVRYIEKMALRSECLGEMLNKQLDSFLSVSQSSSATITGLSHLEAESVAVWANGKHLGAYTVSGGSITVSEAVTTAIVGLVYTAQFKSTRLAYAAQMGTALTQKKRIDKLGLILMDTHYQGLQYGPDFDNLDYLPLVEGAEATAAHTVWTDLDTPMTALPGIWDTDSRLCLQATAPRPCTVSAAVVGMATNER